MSAWRYCVPTSIHFGAGFFERSGELVRWVGARPLVVVTVTLAVASAFSKSVAFRTESSPVGVKVPPARLPVVVPVEMMTLDGSNRIVPIAPSGARRSAMP